MTLTAVLQIYKIATYMHVTRERNKRSTVLIKSVVRTTALRKAVAAPPIMVTHSSAALVIIG